MPELLYTSTKTLGTASRRGLAGRPGGTVVAGADVTGAVTCGCSAVCPPESSALPTIATRPTTAATTTAALAAVRLVGSTTVRPRCPAGEPTVAAGETPAADGVASPTAGRMRWPPD